MNNHIKVEFPRTTKNTYRFQEKTLTDSVIEMLYVQKALFGGQTPKKVRVTVEWE